MIDPDATLSDQMNVILREYDSASSDVREYLADFDHMNIEHRDVKDAVGKLCHAIKAAFGLKVACLVAELL